MGKLEAVFGLGFVHAQDRLWQMHVRRMGAQGRLAEMFGPKALELDKFSRMLSISESAKKIIDNMNMEIKEYLQAYVDGINEGRKSLTMLPIEFQIVQTDFHEWTIYDTLMFQKQLALMNVGNAFQEFMRSTLESLYDRNSSDILSGVGADNQYDKNLSILNEEEIQIYTNIYDNTGYEKARNQEAHKSNQTRQSQMEIQKYLMEWLDQASGLGSNLWVVHGNHTASGKPHLASDPHLLNQIPSIWYQAEIIFNDENNEEQFVIGAQMACFPVWLIGRNKYNAWGITILGSDGADFWEEKISEGEDGKLYYEFKNESHPVREVVETIKIRGQETYNLTVLSTHHGPVLKDFIDRFGYRHQLNGSHYSFQSLVHIDDINGLLPILRLSDYKNFTQMIRELSYPVYPNLGMAFISHDGHIGFLTHGKLIIRDGNPDEGSYVKRGWTGENEWIGFLPLQQIPLAIDPPKGFFALGNNKFFPSNDKYHLAWNTPATSRGRVIYNYLDQKIKSGQKLTIEDHRQLQVDVLDPFCKDQIPKLIKIIEKTLEQKYFEDYLQENDNNQILNEMLNEIRNWDYKFSSESVGATIIAVFEFYYQRTLLKELFESYQPQAYAWSTFIFDTFYFKNIEDIHDALFESKDEEYLQMNWCTEKVQHPCLFNFIKALIQAGNYLIETHGRSKEYWQWSKIHASFYPHVPFHHTQLASLFNRQVPYKGYRRTILASGSDTRSTQTFNGETGPNYRMIISMDPTEKSYYIIDTGISGNILSTHYDDQLQLFAKDEYVELTFGSINLQKYKHQTILKYQIDKEDI